MLKSFESELSKSKHVFFALVASTSKPWFYDIMNEQVEMAQN